MNDKKPDNSYKPSLLVSILRRQEHKNPGFGQRQWQWWYLLKQRVLIFLLMAGAVYMIFWLQTRKPVKTQSESIQQVEQLNATAVLEHKESMSTTDLLYLASQMDLDPNAEIPVQMQWVADRKDIANQLLAKSDDELAQKEGTLYRLEALQLHSNLNRKYKLGHDTIDTQLYELCSANLDHADAEVSKIAAVVVMMTALHQFSNDPNQINLKDALSKCKQITAQLNDDHEIALAIFKYARLMKRSDVMVDDAVEFFQVVVEQFQNSGNEKASSIARKAYREILFGDESADLRYAALLIAGIKDRYRQNRKSVDAELTNRILYSLNEQHMDGAGVEQVVRCLEVLLSKDKIDMADDLSNRVAEFFEKKPTDDYPDAMQKIAQFKKRVATFDSSFSLHGLQQIGDSEILYSGQPTLLVYWAADDSASKRLLNSLKSLGIARVLQCIVVSDAASDEELKLTEKLAKELPMFKFAFVNLDSKTGQKFDSQFPVPQLPYKVLLNADQKVIGINPDIRELGKKIQTFLN